MDAKFKAPGLRYFSKALFLGVTGAVGLPGGPLFQMVGGHSEASRTGSAVQLLEPPTGSAPATATEAEPHPATVSSFQ